MSGPDSTAAKFALICCQQGAEVAIKHEVASHWRLAFSRPGFVTLKSESTHEASLQLPRGVFIRYAGWSLGKVAAETVNEASAALQSLLHGQAFDQLHLWQRDRTPVGKFSFEPGITPLAEGVATELFPQLQASGIVKGPLSNHPAEPGQKVLDVILVEPQQWWIGWHPANATDPSTCWPGGTPRIVAPTDMVSRTYLKTAEGIAWSQFNMRPGEMVVEVGSAPGGSVQRLLELGMRVTGIDPAEMDPLVAEHPQFTHLRARGGDLKRNVYQNCRWLVVDSNVRPDKTLTTVENIVTHRNVSIRGLLLTLKLKDYAMAEQIPEWLARIRQWGYRNVKARQLAFGKTEICVAASK